MAGSTLASPSASPLAVADHTAAVEATSPALAFEPPPPGQTVTLSPGRETWRRFRRHRLAMASAVLLALMISAVLVGPWLWPVPIDEIDFTARLAPPSWAHPFGTDDLGQDILARMIYGGRISLAVGFAAMAVSTIIGTAIGAFAGMSRRMLDPALMWVTDLFLSLPQLPLLLLVIYLFRDKLKQVFGLEGGIFVMIVVVIGGLRWMPVARLVRAQFLSLREKEFVEASRALGASRWHQVTRHILPNAIGPVIVAGTIEVSSAIIAESTLSFLGLGFPPDIPTWGRLLFDAKDHLDVAAHWALFPGAAIFLTVLSINFLGDGLRDALDPRRVI
jgi:peptide/nickel transport system permease protein